MSIRLDRIPRACTRALVPLLLLAGCSDKGPQGPPGPGPAPVDVARASRKDVPIVLEAIGTVTARSAVTVRSRVEGAIERVNFREGEEVGAGDLLFAIDPRPFEAAVRRAEANLARDRALSENAASEVRRYEELVKKDYVTQEDYDANRARAASLEATVRADEAALEEARLELGFSSIRSPIAGRTGEIRVHAGNIVRANDTALVDILTTRPIDVAFAVPEGRLPEIRARMAGGTLSVEAMPRGREGSPVRGTLDFVDNQVDRATGTILLKASFPNEDGALWPGEFVDAHLQLAVEGGAVVVPSEAVQTGQQGTYVFVIGTDLTAELRPVVVGPSAGEEVVIASGLEEGETVVTDGQIRLVPGTRVEIKSGGGTERPR